MAEHWPLVMVSFISALSVQMYPELAGDAFGNIILWIFSVSNAYNRNLLLALNPHTLAPSSQPDPSLPQPMEAKPKSCTLLIQKVYFHFWLTRPQSYFLFHYSELLPGEHIWKVLRCISVVYILTNLFPGPTLT